MLLRLGISFTATGSVTMPRDHVFDGLATGTAVLLRLAISFTATGGVTTPRDIFYGYWRCYDV